jgi:hypothetical protein
MAVFVLDASVAIAWCFPNDATEDTHYSRPILTQHGACISPQNALIATDTGGSLERDKRDNRPLTSTRRRGKMALPA